MIIEFIVEMTAEFSQQEYRYKKLKPTCPFQRNVAKMCYSQQKHKSKLLMGALMGHLKPLANKSEPHQRGLRTTF